MSELLQVHHIHRNSRKEGLIGLPRRNFASGVVFFLNAHVHVSHNTSASIPRNFTHRLFLRRRLVSVRWIRVEQPRHGRRRRKVTRRLDEHRDCERVSESDPAWASCEDDTVQHIFPRPTSVSCSFRVCLPPHTADLAPALFHTQTPTSQMNCLFLHNSIRIRCHGVIGASSTKLKCNRHGEALAAQTQVRLKSGMDLGDERTDC